MRNYNPIKPARRNFLKSVAAGILGASAVSAWTGAQTNSVLNQARTDSSLLKIKSVTPVILQLQRDSLTELKGVHFLLCRIQTDDGITGWGDGSSWAM
jgi:hypothetical protein